jgi:cohesin loading factor subunit SCC2
MKLLQGIKLSHRLQEIEQQQLLQDKMKNNEAVNAASLVVRGFRVQKPGEPPTGLNGFLYSVMKNTKAQRRGVLTSLIKQFDDTAVRPVL